MTPDSIARQINQPGRQDRVRHLARDRRLAERLRAAAPRESALEVAFDLLSQAIAILEETDVHIAAPVVLAGAAVEALLRSMVSEHQLPVVGRHGIATYAAALRTADVITPQEKKELDVWAGLRNTAAHGNFATLTKDDARFMTQGVLRFLNGRKRSSEPA